MSELQQVTSGPPLLCQEGPSFTKNSNLLCRNGHRAQIATQIRCWLAAGVPFGKPMWL